MRYHIDTIPVWDAYKGESECPLCDLRSINEQAYVENFLGASVMEPDVRVEVNQKGFCGPHFAMMITQKNRLGLALMTHTHFQETLKGLERPTPAKKSLFGKKEAPVAEDPGAHCILCERLASTMDRYLYTVLHLYKTDKAFQEAFASSKGLCMPHFEQLTRMAPEALHGAALEGFLDTATRIQRENMERIEKELEWFTLKFDYRNADAPWGNSRDALERAINKLRGKYV